MKRFSLAFDGDHLNKVFKTRETITGEKYFYDPMEYETVDEIINMAFAFMKSEMYSGQAVTFGKTDDTGKTRSICRVYHMGHGGAWDTVYWKRINSADTFSRVPETKKTIKELVLYAIKFDPAMED